MKILDHLSEENIFFDFAVHGKDDFFQKAAAIIVSRCSSFRREEVLQLFLEREKTMSTGIGKKIAIPHIMYGKCLSQQLYIFRLHTPIDFNALDQQPVELIIMFVGPKTESNLPYLQILAKLSRMMKNDRIVAQLLASRSSEAIYQVLRDYEQC
jgi:mannitol/fructose-specific phosphotransferase system IIA component (Ntr-type)